MVARRAGFAGSDPSVGCADSSPYAGEPRAMASAAQKILRPLSHGKPCQLPLRRGAKGGGSVIGCDCLPCARGGGSALAEPVGLLLQRRFKIVPMRILRLPDRKLPTKP